MKFRICSSLRFSLLALCIAIPTAKLFAVTDIVTLRKGERLEGTVTGVKDGAILLEQTQAYGKSTRTFPLADVAKLEFATTDALLARLREGKPPPLAWLAAEWKRSVPFLTIPESPAAAVGLAYVDALLRTKERVEALRAVNIATAIETGAWNSSHRERAWASKSTALLNAGKHEEVEKLCSAAIDPKSPPVIRISAAITLGELRIQQYEIFLKENPRWQIDPFARPERDRRYFEIVDLLLIPYLEYGFPPDLAARSMLTLASFYHKSGEPDAARDLAEDITALYPKTASANAAAALITSLQP